MTVIASKCPVFAQDHLSLSVSQQARYGSTVAVDPSIYPA